MISSIYTAHIFTRWLFRPHIILGSLFLFSLLLFLILIPVPRVDGQLIGSDGTYYYLYVRSLVIDGNIDFSNEYAHFQLPLPSQNLSPLGRIPNKYAIGPALLWMPFFIAAHILAVIGQLLGLPITPDGYGYLYQAAISIGSIVYGAIGFALAYSCSQQLFSRFAALWSVVLLWLAGNAFYYMVFESSMSHMTSLFSVSLLLTVWFTRLRNPSLPRPLNALLIGIASGIVLLVRLQDAIFVIIPFTWIALRIIQSLAANDDIYVKHWLYYFFLASLATMVTFSPQLMAWQYLYGTWNTSPYLYEHSPAFYWLTPQIGPVLFSSFHGLFSWHPVYLIALSGLIIIFRVDKRMAGALTLVLAINIYVVASWWAWWQGDSFGGRMFLNATWIWSLCLTALIHWLWISRHTRIVIVVSFLLVLWNGLSLVQYRLGFVPMNAPLTWEQMTIERLALPWRLLQRIVSRRL